MEVSVFLRGYYAGVGDFSRQKYSQRFADFRDVYSLFCRVRTEKIAENTFLEKLTCLNKRNLNYIRAK